jgi:hypothetical protein
MFQQRMHGHRPPMIHSEPRFEAKRMLVAIIMHNDDYWSLLWMMTATTKCLASDPGRKSVWTAVLHQSDTLRCLLENHLQWITLPN